MSSARRDSDAPGVRHSSELRKRFALNISTWNATEEEVSQLASCFPPEDRDKCNRFLRFADRKRAVASRLLQRSLGLRAFGQRPQDVLIARTDKGKPFFLHAHPTAKNLNFNVSHEVRFLSHPPNARRGMSSRMACSFQAGFICRVTGWCWRLTQSGCVALM